MLWRQLTPSLLNKSAPGKIHICNWQGLPSNSRKICSILISKPGRNIEATCDIGRAIIISKSSWNDLILSGIKSNELMNEWKVSKGICLYNWHMWNGSLTIFQTIGFNLDYLLLPGNFDAVRRHKMIYWLMI